MRAAACAAVALLLAGCLHASAPSAGMAAVAAAPRLSFAPAVKVDHVRNGQSESFIDVTPDGQTMLTCLHGEFQEPSIMYASTDGGAHWKELKATPTPGIGGDCEVALTADGGWHFVHTQAAGITIASTWDKGETWTVDRLAGPPVTTFSDRPWLEASGDAMVLTYDGYDGLVARASADAGRTWGPPQDIVQPPPGYLPISGHLSIAADGRTVLAPYVLVRADEAGERPARNVFLGVAVSKDLGTSWTDERLPATVHALALHPAGAVLSDGMLLTSYYTPNGTAYDLVARTSGDDGRTWSDPWTVRAAVQDPMRAWASARSDGRVDMLVGGSNATFGLAGDGSAIALLRLDPAHRTAPAPWAIVGNASDEFASVTHDGSGRALVVYVVPGGGLASGGTASNALWFVRELDGGPP